MGKPTPTTQTYSIAEVEILATVFLPPLVPSLGWAVENAFIHLSIAPGGVVASYEASGQPSLLASQAEVSSPFVGKILLLSLQLERADPLHRPVCFRLNSAPSQSGISV